MKAFRAELFVKEQIEKLALLVAQTAPPKLALPTKTLPLKFTLINAEGPSVHTAPPQKILFGAFQGAAAELLTKVEDSVTIVAS